MRKQLLHITVFIYFVVFSSCVVQEHKTMKNYGKCYKLHRGKVVYEYQTETGRTIRKKLQEANPETFKLIAHEATLEDCFTCSLWGRDNKNVYFKNIRIENADPKTFEYIGYMFSKDKNRAYCNQHIISKANTNTFEQIGLHFAKDDSNLFYHEKLIQGAEDIASLKVIDELFVADKFNVYRTYFPLRKINNADSKSFISIELSKKYGYYSYRFYKDKKNAYLFDIQKSNCEREQIKDTTQLYIIENIDSESFKPLLKKYYSKDKNNVYYKSEIIKEADNQSFIVNESNSDKFDASDKNSKYKYGKAIKDQ
ncbi:MAG: DKNYY domain-containing protein [Bacteroidales bacterium]|nr:DKNYY domain-containing protein [Bacteroidales bacterium]